MTSGSHDKKSFALICLVLVLGTCALYWPITTHPFILYDDGIYIVGNTHVTTGLSAANTAWAFKSGEAANWHPLTWLSHQLDCTLFGLNAGRHHLVNLLFHVANTLLVFVFLRSATGALWRSALVAALFAWHPLHVESVAWASERKDVLSTFFWVLTLVMYVRFANLSKLHDPKSKLFYVLALFFFAGGLMSKPMVVTLPFVLLLLDFWPLARTSNLKSLLLEKIPFFALAVAGSAVTYLVQTGAGAVWATSLPDRLANADISYARYIIKFFYPADLAIVYSHPQHWPVIYTIGALALLAVLTIPIILNLRRQPVLAVGWFWFLGTLVPTIGLVQVGAQSMADRYTYIPSIGFFLAVVWGGWELLSTRSHGKLIFQLLAGAALLGCVLVTSLQVSYWHDNRSLFLHAIEVSPDNYLAENCLGKTFETDGDLPRALVLYRNAVELEPCYPQSQFNYALALLTYGDRAEALKHLQAAAALEPANPDIQFDLGLLYGQANDWTNAAGHLEKSVAVRPDFPMAQENLGSALVHLAKYPEAASCYREALRLQPVFPVAKSELDQLLAAHPELR